MKELLKKIKLNESTISMIFGSIVIIAAGLFVVNYFKNLDTGDVNIPAGIEEKKSLPTTHKIAKGETLWSISEKYYETGYNWVEVQKANNLNNPGDIEEGKEIIIPELKQEKASEQIETKTDTEVMVQAEQKMELGDKTYTVIKGDNLWKIAETVYGNGYKWVEIARVNNLTNPNTIHTGNILILP